jgi:subtilase family serine protease
VLAVAGAAASAAPVTTAGAATGLADVPIAAPRILGLITKHATANTDCVLPDGTHVSFYHCYTPQQIRAAFGVNAVVLSRWAAAGCRAWGQGQTIVLVDSYGSPTAAADLAHFHPTFFPKLPAPSFEQIFPLGNPQYHNTCHGKGLSGNCAAAGWSGEATLDIEWAYSIAPLAHLVLLAVPPAETEGVQGFPNLFKPTSCRSTTARRRRPSPAPRWGSAGRCSSRSATCRTTSSGRSRSRGTRPQPGTTPPPGGVPPRLRRSSTP